MTKLVSAFGLLKGRSVHLADASELESKTQIEDASSQQGRKRVLVCARIGDNLYQPGRARSIWALNTAQAVERNGYETWLLGRSSNVGYNVAQPSGMAALRRHLEGVYNVSADVRFTLPNAEPGFRHSQDGTWEFESGFVDRIVSQVDFAHVRDPRLLPYCAKHGVPFAYEDHNEDYHLAITDIELAALSSNHCKCVVAITAGVGERLTASGVPSAAIVVEDSGVDADSSAREIPKLSAWRKFLCGRSFDSIACYGGGLQAERGIDQILGAAGQLPRTVFVVAGGTPEDQRALMEQRREAGCRNLKVCGYLDQRTFRQIAQASDVLLYTRANNDRAAITSPLKYFDYLTAGSPIVAFDIPAIRRTASPGAAITLYGEDSGDALASAITRSLSAFPWKPDGYADNLRIARRHDWRERERRILERVTGGGAK